MSTSPRGWPATLTAGYVSLRPPERRDAAAWSEARLRNEQWLKRWEPTSPSSWADRSSPGTWRTVVANHRRAARDATALPFVIVYRGRLVGQMNIGNIVQGVLQSGTAGYWVDSAVAGRGIAPTALALAIDHCFLAVGLHRIEVAIRPENAASLRVVEKLRLRREGAYERYLNIDGDWRDHIAFAITAEEVRGTSLLSRALGGG